MLFHGPPGLGKTTLAHIIAAEMGGKLVTTSGPALEKTADLMGILTNLEPGDVLFVDEIHRTPRAIEEYLYPAMEDFAVDFVLDKGPFAKAIRLSLKRFTLVGATTRAGLLSSPLRDRFGLSSTWTSTAGGAGSHRRPLRGHPRRGDHARGRRPRSPAARGARRASRIACCAVCATSPRSARGRKSTSTLTRASLKLEGVDDAGLDELDRKVLDTIIRRYDGGPVGIEALAATLQEEVDTLTDVVEPYLLKTASSRGPRPSQGDPSRLRAPADPPRRAGFPGRAAARRLAVAGSSARTPFLRVSNAKNPSR